MLIGALLVIACGLLVAGFVTGVTAYAIGALVLSLAGAALYVVALRRFGPEAADEADEQAPPSAETATRVRAPAKDRTAAVVSKAKKSDAERAARSAPVKQAEPVAKKPANAVTAAAKPVEAKPAGKTEAAQRTEPVADRTEPVTSATTEKKAPEKKAPEKKAPEKKAAEKKAPAKKLPETTAAAQQPAVASTTATPEKAPEKAPEVPPKPAPTGAGEPGGSGIVHVVPGRMRYHVEGCKLLDGREDAEALTLDDAKDEGFSACSRCASRKVLTTQA